MWSRRAVSSASAVASQLCTAPRCKPVRCASGMASGESSEVEEAPVVHVTQGALRGRSAIAKSGGRFLSFQGVPYARPPLGPLRFEPPEPPEPWTGVRDALQEGSVCPHRDWIQGLGFRGEEDCLFLNVYVSELLPQGTPKKPVMVWIHGGGYYIGSGNTDMYGPDYLVEAGVVVVTLNYRLGALGFLSLEDSSYPGNMGLRDQVAALLWVKSNIAQFGGDPNNVTLFGESAGSSCVQYHMVSPMSKGLFHKAISQSGSVFNPWAMASSSLRKRAFNLGEVLGCNTSDPTELVKFLKTVPPKDLVEGSAKIITKEEKRKGDVLSFNPIPEKEIPGKACFLPGNPQELLSAGKYHDVPFMAGVTSHEGILDLTAIIKHPPLAAIIDKDFDRIVPQDLNVLKDTSQEIADQIKKFYFGDKAVSMETLEDLSHVYSDLNFNRGMDKTMKLLAQKSSSPLYYYKFAYDGELGIFKKFIDATFLPGVSHMDDLGYMFCVEALDEEEQPNEQDMSIIRKMVKMWTNFAKTGDPSSKMDGDVNIKWTPFTMENPVYLNINNDLKMEEKMFQKRLEFWDQLYRKYNKQH